MIISRQIFLDSKFKLLQLFKLAIFILFNKIGVEKRGLISLKQGYIAN